MRHFLQKSILFSGALSLFFALPVFAATIQTILPGTIGWDQADIRPGGNISFVSDNNAPYGTGALKLETDGTHAAKGQYLTANHTGTKLTDVQTLGYWTKQVSASFEAGLPSYQLAIDTDGILGDGKGFTTLVFEPYNNYGNDAVLTNTWQEWNVSDGTFWSSRNIAAENGNGGLVAGAGGPPFYSLSDVKAKYPNAIVVSVGVNVGTYNPSYNTLVDGLRFNDSVYDFEPAIGPATSMNQCKGEGWKTFNSPAYKNQGDCVSSVVSKGKNK